MKNKLEKIIEYGIYLIIFFLPWQTRWLFKIGQLNGGFWEYGTMSLYGLDFLVVLTVILGGVYFFKFKKQGEIEPRKWLFLILFLLWSGLSIFWSIEPSLSAYYFLRLFLVFGLIFTISIIKLDFKKIALAFVAAGFIQSFLAVWQFFTQNFFASKWLGMAYQSATHLGAAVIEIGDMRWLRAYGSFPHPNILAGFLGVSILLAIYLLDKDEKWRKRLIYFLPILILGLLVSFSKSAILAFFICFCLFYFIKWLKRKEENNIDNKEGNSPLPFGQVSTCPYMERRGCRRNPFFVIILSFIIFSILLWPFISTRFLSTERLELISQNERISQLQISKELIKNHWFKGSGLNTYTLALEQKHPNFASWFYQPVHNVFLIIWGELGLVGLILFLSFFTLRVTTRHPTDGHSRDDRVVFFIFYFLFSKETSSERKIIIFSLLLFLLITSLFDHYFWTLNCGMVLWWIILRLSFKQNAISENFE